jgi:putative transposase
MTRLKIDENIHSDAARFLRSQGHDPATVCEQGLRGKGDAELAGVAAYRRTLLFRAILGWVWTGGWRTDHRLSVAVAYAPFESHGKGAGHFISPGSLPNGEDIEVWGPGLRPYGIAHYEGCVFDPTARPSLRDLGTLRLGGNPGLKSWANLEPSLRDGAFVGEGQRRRFGHRGNTPEERGGRKTSAVAAESAGGAVQVSPGVHSWGFGVHNGLPESRRDDRGERRDTMGHTYTFQTLHCVFSTKERVKILRPEIREQLWPYMAGICDNHGYIAHEIGGVADHAHLLIGLPAKESLAKAMQTLKGGSSKWINETFFPRGPKFRWQEGYGAFSVGVSGIKRTVEYIRRQEEHHRRRSFESEFLGFLRRHGISYDERHVFG